MGCAAAGKNSGYIQTIHPQLLLPLAAQHGVTIGLRHRVGQHLVAGTVLGWVWTPSPDEPRPNAESFEAAVLSDVRIGFERTVEQDIGFGIRQQTDIACKALSPAVNDPYTAVQALDHLSVICCDLAVRPLGAKVLTGPAGKGCVIVPGGTFDDYVRFISAAFGRYGSSDVIVMLALLRLFPKLRRGAAHRFRPLGRFGSGRRHSPRRRRTIDTTPHRS
jgi:uncharacterized membrane protein